MRRRYVVAYDIRQERRLREVHKTATAYGYPLQYSVFICDLDFSEKLAMRQDLGEIINHWEDDIVFIDVGEASGRGAEAFEFIGARSRSLPQQGPQIV